MKNLIYGNLIIYLLYIYIYNFSIDPYRKNLRDYFLVRNVPISVQNVSWNLETLVGVVLRLLPRVRGGFGATSQTWIWAWASNDSMREVEQFCEHPKFPKSSTTTDKSTMVVRLPHYTTKLHNNTRVLENLGFLGF